MLKSIKVRNFYSIGEEQELSFSISPAESLNSSSVKIENNSYVNLANCIIGANASGKTKILQALSFITYFAKDSYEAGDDLIPIKSHALKQDEPSFIEIEFFEKKKLFKYSIELNEKEVLKESLYVKNIKGFSYIFRFNHKNDNKIDFSSHWEKYSEREINPSDKKRLEELRQASILSGLMNTGYLPKYSIFKNRISNITQNGYFSYNQSGLSFVVSKKLSLDKDLSDMVLKFTKDIDFGIDSFDYKELLLGENHRATMLQCQHKSTKGEFSLSLNNESHGTKNSIYILTKLLPILKTGGLAILDEFDSELHPFVARKIISLFEDETINTGKAQLVFSTHQHLLMKDRTKTQIFICEKNSNTFETEIYRLDDVQGVRNDENYFQKYLAGAYGGNPNITSF